MGAFVISNDAWKRIPDEFKAALLESTAKTTKILNESLEKTDRECIAKMANAGCKLIVPTKEQLDAWASEFEKNANDVLNANSQALNRSLFDRIHALLSQNKK